MEESNTKSNSIIKNIKSEYFLQKIINNLQKIRSLDIIRYSKKIQKMFNITMKNYKDSSELYSSIKIELIPVGNKFGKFINIPNKEEEKYYHIYFNNIKENINRIDLKENENIKKIEIKIDYQIKSLENLFYQCKCIKSIDFKQFNRNNINNMSSMFYECSSLKEINLNHFNTTNVNLMSDMFNGCSLLEKINLSKFCTNKVNDTSYMFCGCSSLKELNLNNFNTSMLTFMKAMF